MDYKQKRDTECGFGVCHPKWLQPLAGIKSFVFSYGLVGLFSWSLWTMAVSQITNIEKAFGLSSSETGWLLTIWELGFLACAVPASYFTTKAHVPRVIGIFTVINGISGLVMAIPHFVVFTNVLKGSEISMINETDSKVAPNELGKHLCSNLSEINVQIGDENHIPEIVSGVSKKTLAYVIFCIAMVLQGVGKGPCHPYSSQYIDDNGDKQNTGLYVGIGWFISVFGLAVGYGIGSATDNIYVTMADTVLQRTDTRFIGAWWLGFIVMGFTIIIIAVPMFCYPRNLDNKEKENVVEQHPFSMEHQYKRRALMLINVKAAGFSLIHIMRHPIYTLTLVASCFQVLASACFLGFEPKYFQTQFSVPSWKANIILGVASIGAYAVGCLVGGYLTKRYKLSPFRILLLILSLWLIVIVLNIVSTFLGCPNQDIYNPLDLDESEGVSSSACDCSSTQFIPICGNDGRNYYSPCHAGCHNVTSEVFTNCDYIPGRTAKSGMCSTGCVMLWIYTAVKSITNVFDSIAGVPIFVVFLRSTGDTHKGLAIALSSAIVSLTGWLPGPIIGGKVVDNTCLIWNTASTGSQFCAFYNTEQLRYHVHALIIETVTTTCILSLIGFRVIAVSVLLLTIYKAREMKEWSDSERNSDRTEIIAADSDDVKQKLSINS